MKGTGMITRILFAVGWIGIGIGLGKAQAQGGAGSTDANTEEVRVTMRGNPVVLMGMPVKEGKTAPDFKVVDAGFKAVQLSDFKGQVVLISAVPSLDTGVCAAQTKRFNQEAVDLPTNVVIMTISEDLPFAQKRFCEAEKVDRIKVLSDSVWRQFGTAYGLLIKDMGLLTRSVWIVGRDGRVAYRQIVPEITSHPDYDAALKAAREAAVVK